MGALDLTVQVLNLSPSVTPGELITFFSYCGTVEKMQLQRNKDQSQSALVTFRQPYAYQTSLLLNNANFADQPIRIMRATDLANPPSEDNLTNGIKKNEMQGFIPAIEATTQALASKDVEILKKNRDEEEGKGGATAVRTRSISVAKQAAKIMNQGTTWFSGSHKKASK